MARGINPPGMWGADDGRALSQGLARPESQTVYVTGQVAWDPDHELVGPGDARAQTEQRVDNIETVLGGFGGRLEDIVSLTVYFVNRKDLPEIREARARRLYFPEGTAPVRILIQVSGLVLPEFLVEIVPVAVVPFDRYVDPR